MKKLYYVGLLATLLVATPHLEASVQAGSPCLPSDSLTTYINLALVGFVTSADTEWVRVRNAVHLPALTSADVQIVTDSTTCAAAAAALVAETPGGDASPAAWVIKLGPTRFIAFNLRRSVAGSGYLYVYDNNWVKLSEFTL